MTVCGICLDVRDDTAMQVLPCGHLFCKECLDQCTLSMVCPAPSCTYIRRMKVVIDEADECYEEDNQDIPSDMSPFMPQIGGRRRCDGRRGTSVLFVDGNLLHRKVEAVTEGYSHTATPHHTTKFSSDELPYCPVFRCADRLLKNEVKKVGERAPHMQKICADLINAMPDDPPEQLSGKDEYVLCCSVYHSENSTKSITYPTACTILDMISAMIQLQGLKKTRTAYNISVFNKTTIDGKVKHEPFDVKSLSKKKIKETDIVDHAHFVLDVYDAIKRTSTKK